MAIRTTTHLNLPGTARAALEFYGAVFGGRVVVTTYADLGMSAEAPGADDIVFGVVESPEGFRVMAYDVPGHGVADTGTTRRENGVTITDRPFFLSVRADSAVEAERYWQGLAEGATVVEPFAASAWSPGFGMLTDRFGVTWVLDVEPAPAA
ncbi:VOC family protein [Microbacterium resistens]|uniref:VOC family protein n=1 Tax=Microbacterium resistens TaxID=156977 RepID=A0ABY3RNN9_9MICO|nr:VOC family protein [Microbacterium resistens]UGS25454.1 VOC family protein [Microbacterium resistens]